MPAETPDNNSVELYSVKGSQIHGCFRYDSRVKAMEVDERPTEQYSDIGGLDKQIQEVKKHTHTRAHHLQISVC